MLTEIKKIKQVTGEPVKRWFHSEQMDLFVWYDNNQFISFQLCYDKEKDEKAISWHKDKSLQHQKVDDGENHPGHYKATPILLQNESIDLNIIVDEFKKHSLNLIDEIKGFVLNKIEEAIEE